MGAETEAYYRRQNVKQRRSRIPLTPRTVPSTLGVAANLDLPAVRIQYPLVGITASRENVGGNVSVFVGGILRVEITPRGVYTLAAAGATWNDVGDTVVRLTGNVPAAFPTAGTVYLKTGAGTTAYTYTGVAGTDLTGIAPPLAQDYSGAKATLGAAATVGSLAAGDLLNLRIVDGFAGSDTIRFFGSDRTEIAWTRINASG